MSNDSSSKCPQCGAALSDSALGGLCPSCLMALNLKTETVLSGEAPSAQAPLPPEQIAPHFPQLEILECLGRGGMGVVYKARQKTLNRFVALKLLAPERVGDSKFAERFAREAQALAALNHPNIVTVHDFGQAGGFYYLLMEFVDGVNLRQLLRTRKFTPEEALAIVPPLCDALQFAHERGIVHRDIKPENLLLDKAGRVKIADFGIAKMLDSNGGIASEESASNEFSSDASKPSDSSGALTAGQVLGTRGYSAPEQMNAERVDSRADIYSLGVVFYEMLTGELPGKKIEPPSRKVQIDVRLDAVVLRALEKTPELRWQTAADLRTQVETIAIGPLENEKAEAEAKPSAPPTKRPWQLVVLAILFILSGCWSALNIGPDFLTRNYNFDFGVLTLPMGIGLLRLRPWWRKAAIGSLLLVLAFVVFVVGSAVAGHPSRRWLAHDFSFNYDVSAGTKAAGFVGVGLGLGLLLLPLYVLMRTDVKALFKRRGFSRPYIEWSALFAVLILSFGCAAVFNKANERGKLSGEIVSEMPRRPDRVREIEDGRFVAQLPDNGRVELLAVHPHPATNSGWWKPDGSPSPFGSDIQTEAGENHAGGVVALVRVQWPNRYESWPRPRGAMTNVTSVTLKGGINFLTRSGQRYSSDDVSAMYFEQAALFDDHATLFMGVATGEWRTLIVQKPGFLNYIFSGSARREWSFSETPDGNLKVTIRHLVENAQHEYRLVAVDVDGMEYLPNQTSRQHVSTDSFSTLEAIFSPVSGSGKTWNLPLNRVREVRWEFRPYETVEFRNVSLKPGHQTTVQVRDFGEEDKSFGPVIERVVNDGADAKGIDMFLGLVSGQLSSEPTNLLVLSNFTAMGEWMNSNGLDFQAVNQRTAWNKTDAAAYDDLFFKASGHHLPPSPIKGICCVGMSMLQFDPGEWNLLSPNGLIVALKNSPVSPLRFYSAAEELPLTWGFKTHAGAIGLLQITGFTENPRGVKIRYKLVQPDAQVVPSRKEGGVSRFTRTEIITIAADGSLTVAGEACPVELLSERVKQLAARQPASVEIRADKAALMKWVVAVTKACEEAGLHYSAVATDRSSADTTAGNDDQQPVKQVLGRLQMIASGAYRNLAIARTESVCGFPWHEVVARYSGPELADEVWNSSKVVDGRILCPSPDEEEGSGPEPVSTFCVSLDTPQPKASSCWYPAPNECQLRFALPTEKDAKDAAEQMNLALSKPVTLVAGKRIPLFTVGERKAWLEVREPQLPKAKLAFITSETWNCGDWPRAGWSPIERGTNAVNSNFRIESAVLMTRPRSILNVIGEHDFSKAGSSNVFSVSITNNTSQAGLYWVTWFPGSVSNLLADGWGMVFHDARTAREISRLNFTEPMPKKWRADWYYSSVLTNDSSLETVLLINDGMKEPGNMPIPNAILRLKIMTFPLTPSH